MKAHKKRRRLLTSLALATSVAGLAASSAASAAPLRGDPPLRHENNPAFVLPAGPRTDVQTGSLSAARPYVLPSSHKTDAQTTAARRTAPVQPPSSVVREIRTVSSDGTRTLAIVLAAAALGIALCGTLFAAIRLAHLQRRVVGSSS